MFIVGEPGVGKTRLAAAAAVDAAERGFTVLHGRCDEGLAAPYQPVVEAIRPWLVSCPDAALARTIGEDAAELVCLWPELAPRLALTARSGRGRSGDATVASVRGRCGAGANDRSRAPARDNRRRPPVGRAVDASPPGTFGQAGGAAYRSRGDRSAPGRRPERDRVTRRSRRRTLGRGGPSRRARTRRGQRSGRLARRCPPAGPTVRAASATHRRQPVLSRFAADPPRGRGVRALRRWCVGDCRRDRRRGRTRGRA